MRKTGFFLILLALTIIVNAQLQSMAAQQTASQPAPTKEKETPPPERTRFDRVPANDPRREIIQTVLDSTRLTTGLMTEEVWKTADFQRPWQRASQYFPQSAYFTTSQEHFLTHFFNPQGFQEIEIFDSAYLRMCVQNRGTFTRDGVVGAYRQMLTGDPAGAASFSQKLGELEPYFHDENSKENLRQMIGDDLFDRLLKELREEGYHLFAGALIHEGVHAGMDDPGKVAAIQEKYKACKLAVQWDELRAYMTEISYHGRFYNWAVNDIFASWRRIDDLLKELEKLRKKPKPLSKVDKDSLEALKAKIKAYIALIRLRMRELQDSARRMQGLLASFLKGHLKPEAPASDRKALEALLKALTTFTEVVGQELQRQELLLKGLESYLDLWNRWASCELNTPPDRKVVEEIIKKARGTRWTSPPLSQTEELRKRGEKEVAKFSIASGEVPVRPSGPGSERLRNGQHFSMTTYYVGTSPSMNRLNSYLGYLNATWNGNLPEFSREHGFGATVGYRLSSTLETGLIFERISARISGTLDLSGGDYVSSHSLNMFGLYLTARTPELLTAVRLSARAGIFYCLANYKEAENGFVTAGNEDAIGWSIAAGPEVDLTRNLSMSLSGGYRQATLEGFGVSFFMPGDPPVSLDFSGFTTQVGLTIRF